MISIAGTILEIGLAGMLLAFVGLVAFTRSREHRRRVRFFVAIPVLGLIFLANALAAWHGRVDTWARDACPHWNLTTCVPPGPELLYLAGVFAAAAGFLTLLPIADALGLRPSADGDSFSKTLLVAAIATLVAGTVTGAAAITAESPAWALSGSLGAPPLFILAGTLIFGASLVWFPELEGRWGRRSAGVAFLVGSVATVLAMMYAMLIAGTLI